MSVSDQNERTRLNGRFMDVAGLASYLGLEPSWIYDRTGPACNDRIPHFKMGKYLRFDVQSAEFNEWLNRNFRN